MLHKYINLVLAYGIVMLPACSGANQSSLKGNQKRNTKKSSLSKDQLAQVNAAKNTVVKLLEAENFTAHDAKGAKVKSEDFMKQLSSHKSDLYIVDNTNDQTDDYMIQLKMLPVSASNKTSKQTNQIAISASIWKRGVFGEKDDFIASARQYAQVGNNESNNIRNLKSAVQSVISNISQQASISDSKLQRVMKTTILIGVTVMVASVLIGAYLASNSHGPESLGYLILGGVGFAAGAGVGLIAALVKRIDTHVKKKKPFSGEAYPDFQIN